MTLTEFDQLSNAAKIEAVYSGIPLASRNKGKFKFQLYFITPGNFYVEVKLHDKDDKLVEFKPFESDKLLDPYMDEYSVLNLMF